MANVAASASDQQLFADAFNASPIGIVVEDLEGQPLFTNPAFCDFLGFTPDELRNKHCVDFSPAEDAQKDWELFQQLRAGAINRYQLEKRYFRKDGSLVWGRLNLSLLNSRPSPLVIAMVEDITEQKASQEREHRALATLDLVTSQMAAAVTRCSRDFRFLWANQPYADWIKRPSSEIANHHIAEVLGPEAFEILKPYFDRVLAGETVTYEKEMEFPTIGRRWVSATYVPTFDSAGSADGWVGVVLDITERKRAEEARFRHAAIVESHEDAIISKNLDGIITGWNAGAERIFGYREAEVLGQPITILIPPELRHEEVHILEKLRAGGRIEHYETQRITKQGIRVDVSLTIGPIKDATGAIVGFSKIAHDITKRKQGEAALAESEARFRLVADTAPVLIWMSDCDKLCTFFNQTWLAFTGRRLQEELGHGWAEGVFPDDLQRCMDTYVQSFDRREKFRMEYRLRRYDGEYRWVLDIGVPRFNQGGSFAGYIGIAVDVTEQKLAEQSLRGLNRALEEQTALLTSREELLKSFVKNAPAGVAMFDREMRYLQVSDRWCADYGLDSSQVIGRSHYELLPDLREEWKDAHRRGLAGETLRSEEEAWVRQTGTTWLHWEIRPWKTADGTVGGILIFAEDITKRKQMEEALRQSGRKLIEAQELERQRIGRELHDDINQRLALLAMGLQSLHDDPSNLQERLQRLIQETTQLGSEVQGIAHELHGAKLEYLGVVAGIRSWSREFGLRHRIDVQFNCNVVRELPENMGLCLFRILQEALHNAVKHGGAKRIDIQLTELPDAVDLTIRDSGTGFDVEQARGARGLGLISMQERVRLLNGSIAIDSRPACGTVIKVRVPLPEESGAALPAA